MFGGDQACEAVLGSGGGGQVAAGLAAFPPPAGASGMLELVEPCVGASSLAGGVPDRPRRVGARSHGHVGGEELVVGVAEGDDPGQRFTGRETTATCSPPRGHPPHRAQQLPPEGLAAGDSDARPGGAQVARAAPHRRHPRCPDRRHHQGADGGPPPLEAPRCDDLPARHLRAGSAHRRAPGGDVGGRAGTRSLRRRDRPGDRCPRSLGTCGARRPAGGATTGARTARKALCEGPFRVVGAGVDPATSRFSGARSTS